MRLGRHKVRLGRNKGATTRLEEQEDEEHHDGGDEGDGRLEPDVLLHLLVHLRVDGAPRGGGAVQQPFEVHIKAPQHTASNQQHAA